ncbi:EamA/RhaT family transporter [Myroides sp. 1354]|uniref:EamA family transporter n=1 Tax=unclassified Myroides TaxID=2642485 RepID=UPI002574EA8A|nr:MULTISPECIES: EamA/RhaT family transporter [unclassified Myroides]MDM1044761.1 EamA/RhaT family transporter [Myroides sp. R163-1]MDM1055474.1 EamA/RhaT family transporter [Myroides sp. 1354]MDM1068771.1 EamA/RhaT family transporter [Myroides sp. 1372]
MIYLLCSILGSVSVGVFFKYIKKYSINIFEIIIINYVITSVLSFFIFQVDLTQISVAMPWKIIASLGVLLPTIFVVQFYSIKHAGLIKTDIAQRLSLLIPILAAIFIFQESLNTMRYIALAVGLVSVYFILNKGNAIKTTHSNTSTYYLLGTFFGFGIIDICFKQLALYSAIPYTQSLFYVFATALILSLIAYVFGTKKNIFKIKKLNLVSGIFIGGLNFVNIIFYMKAHQHFSSNPTIVFAGMNFGVIFLGTLLGYTLFNEKLNRKNIIGLVLAALAITLLIISLN